MPDSQTSQFLVCYDIAHPKRLSRVHRHLKKLGLPVQYSVFTVIMTRPQLEYMLAKVNNIINAREDDVRCYSLPEYVDLTVLGKQIFTEGVLLLSAQGKNRVL